MVWSATAGARSLDQLASGLGHGLSTHSGRLHCHDLDHNDGALDIMGRVGGDGSVIQHSPEVALPSVFPSFFFQVGVPRRFLSSVFPESVAKGFF